MVVILVLPAKYHLHRDWADVFEGFVGDPISLTVELPSDNLVPMVKVLLEVPSDGFNFLARASIQLPLDLTICEKEGSQRGVLAAAGNESDTVALPHVDDFLGCQPEIPLLEFNYVYDPLLYRICKSA